MATTLFVYGTLKRGLRNHHLLAGQQFVREARSLPHYHLFDTGPFPGLALATGDGHAIRGELWLVDDATMSRLDVLEVTPMVFVRGAIAIEGSDAPAIAYFYNQDVTGLRNCGESWP